MAVAVKTSPGSRSAGTLTSPALLSLLGVAYLLFCLVIVFKLIPGLWWEAWNNLFAGATVIGGTLLALVALTCGIALLILGSKLLGPEPPAGVKAGVFVAFTGLLVAVLLARWISLWIEHWTYTRQWDPGTAATATAILGGLLIVGWIALFLREGTQKMVQVLEAGGWFSAAAYKHNQGQKVRRGTIFGLLVIVAAGIYTMLSHSVLRGDTDLVLNLPFTGKVAIESFGDAQQFIAGVPADKRDKVLIRWQGIGTGLKAGEVVSFAQYREAVSKSMDDASQKNAFEKALPNASSAEVPAYLTALNRSVIDSAVQQLLNSRDLYPDVRRRPLQVQYDQSSWADLGTVVVAAFRDLDDRTREELITRVPALKIPTAVMVLDRFTLRDVNAQTAEDQNVKIRFKGDWDRVKDAEKVKEGDIVGRQQFDEVVADLEKQKEKAPDLELPVKVALAPASGQTAYTPITLLPSVQFTVPLLLLAASLWLAWRVVNMPTFADFLIATEAELNKVSWTTQKKLVQDTIVVLVTVVLMSVFLFGMDWGWKVILSFKPIGVLHIPPEETEKDKKTEAKNW